MRVVANLNELANPYDIMIGGYLVIKVSVMRKLSMGSLRKTEKFRFPTNGSITVVARKREVWNRADSKV